MIYRRNPRIQWREVDGSPVLLDDVEGELIHFSDVGAVLWRELDGQKTIADLARALGREFDAPEAVLENDARGFLKKLERMELVERD